MNSKNFTSFLLTPSNSQAFFHNLIQLHLSITYIKKIILLYKSYFFRHKPSVIDNLISLPPKLCHDLNFEFMTGNI